MDGWGKIDPRQMGEDNRQTAERKDWSLGFGAKIRFFFPPKSEDSEVFARKSFISVDIRDNLNGNIMWSDE